LAGSVDAQVSNDQVAGATFGEASAVPSSPLQLAGAEVVGAGDPTPIGTVIARTSAAVAKVRLTVPGSGSDEMTPKDGYAVLARGVAGLTPAPFVPAKVPPPVAPGAPQTGGTVAPGASQGLPMIASFPIGLGFPAGTTIEAFDGSGKVLSSITLPSTRVLTGQSCPAMGLAQGKGSASQP
jgi:hypothetical protein